MRETSFIKQNKDKWKEFEQILEDQNADPDKLNDVFVQITDDLSYSRTFYPYRSVRVYLNSLAQKIFYSIYKNRKTHFGRLISFWTEELPQLVYAARKEFILALSVFVIAFLIGALSSQMDPEFPRVMLGDDYVEMTLENIESGDPMAVYKQRGEFGMSLGITANNLFVAFLTFILGIFFAIGSIAIIVQNAIMIGAFQYFFYEQGVFQESFLTIWIHGTLEISAIIIAGAAGITMGKGLVFPGTYSRLQAFQISARRGLKIMLGITPIIMLAGFIESYLTRYTETPDIVRGLFILVSFLFVIGYFVIYPMMKAKAGFKNPIKDTELPPNNNQSIDFSRIKSSGEIFADIFIYYKKYFKSISMLAFVGALFYSLTVFLFSGYQPEDLFYFPSHLLGSVLSLGQFFQHELIPYLPLVTIPILSILVYISFLQLIRESNSNNNIPHFKEKPLYYLANLVKIIVATSIFVLLLKFTISAVDSFNILLLFPLCLFIFPLVILWMYIMFKENTNMFASVSRLFSLIKGNYGLLLGLFFLLISISVLFYSIMDTVFIWFYFEVVGWNLSLEQETLNQIVIILLTFTSIFILNLVYTMIVTGLALLYHSLLEIQEAPTLRERIKQIGTSKRIQGIERER